MGVRGRMLIVGSTTEPGCSYRPLERFEATSCRDSISNPCEGWFRVTVRTLPLVVLSSCAGTEASSGIPVASCLVLGRVAPARCCPGSSQRVPTATTAQQITTYIVRGLLSHASLTFFVCLLIFIHIYGRVGQGDQRPPHQPIHQNSTRAVLGVEKNRRGLTAPARTFRQVSAVCLNCIGRRGDSTLQSGKPVLRTDLSGAGDTR